MDAMQKCMEAIEKDSKSDTLHRKKDEAANNLDIT